MGNPGEHAELGDQLIWFAVPLLVLSLALVWLDRRQRAGQTVPTRSLITRVVAALALVAALAASVQVYRVGDSGARAAWSDRVR